MCNLGIEGTKTLCQWTMFRNAATLQAKIIFIHNNRDQVKFGIKVPPPPPGNVIFVYLVVGIGMIVFGITVRTKMALRGHVNLLKY